MTKVYEVPEMEVRAATSILERGTVRALSVLLHYTRTLEHEDFVCEQAGEWEVFALEKLALMVEQGVVSDGDEFREVASAKRYQKAAMLILGHRIASLNDGRSRRHFERQESFTKECSEALKFYAELTKPSGVKGSSEDG